METVNAQLGKGVKKTLVMPESVVNGVNEVRAELSNVNIHLSFNAAITYILQEYLDGKRREKGGE